MNCVDFTKHYYAWLHISITFLPHSTIIRKYNESNHRDRAQINVNSDKKLHNDFRLVSRPSHLAVAEISVGRRGGRPHTFAENDEFSEILTYKGPFTRYD